MPGEPTDTPTNQAFAQEVLRAEADAVLQAIDRLDDRFDQAVDMVAGCEGHVIVSGVGKSGLIGQKLSATFASLGIPSHFLHPTEAMHGDLGRIRSNDLVIGLSYSGNSDEILSLGALVRQDGVPVIAISANDRTHLGRLGDVCLCVGDLTEACPHNLAPTASTTAMLAVGDALALAASRAKGFGADDFQKRHPGGMLGRQLMPVMDVLRFRAGENLPVAGADQKVRDVLSATGSQPRRAGAVLLTGPDGKLAGIFTDADLRRLLLAEGPEALDRTVGDVMTQSPKSLPHEAQVRDAVQMVRELRVDELPVIDGEQKPVGLLDVQDLIALKVIEE